jgi:hypothetical protein
MPAADTFDCEPIGQWVKGYLLRSKLSLDPFARNKRWFTFTNDINPNTAADYHMDAEVFLNHLASEGKKVDLAIMDPPYSPRQIAECYQEIGKKVTMTDTQSATLYQRVRNALVPILSPNAIVLSFGWNTVGMGKDRGFEMEDVMLVCHGGAHNDTICIAERLVPSKQSVFAL